MTESNRIEYKLGLTEDLEKEAVAFLNYQEGGVLYIGVDKTGMPVGVKDVDGDMLKIKDRLKNNIMPSCLGLFDVGVEMMEGREVIKVIFASGTEKPYYIKRLGMSERGVFIRVGSAAEPMPVRMIESLFSRRARHSIGRIISPNQHLTFEQLKIYYEAVGKVLNQQFAVNLELLAEDGRFNYAAYLLADVNGTSIKVAKYAGHDRVDLVENNEYGYCSLIKATKQVLDKMEVENRTVAKITSKDLWLMSVLTVAVTVAFYFILSAFNTANLFFSTLTVATRFAAAYITYKRSPYFAAAYALNDIVLIVLWSMATAENISYLSVLCCFAVFLANDIYAFFNWLRMRRRQEEGTVG